MSKVLVFDLETTGLPDWKKPSEGPEQPHIVQLAALLVDDEDWSIQDMMCVIVKPEGWGWDEDNEAFKVHGITMEQALEKGVPEKEALSAFIDLWAKCNLRIAHNITFDNRIIRIGLKRYFQHLCDSWKETKYECTGRLAKPHNPEWASQKGFKVPSLKDCYQYFIGEELTGHHDALADSKSCLDIYRAIKERGKPDTKPTHPTMGLDDVFKFGKNKGQQLEDVIADDPSYIEWLIKNNVVDFDDEANELITKKKIA